MMRRLSTEAMQRQCDRFNSRFSVGDIVRGWSGMREGEPREFKVRFPAEILSGHTPVVYVEGGAGCLALSHVQF